MTDSGKDDGPRFFESQIPDGATESAKRYGSRPVGQVRGILAERVILSTYLDPFLSLKALAQYSGLSRRTVGRYLRETPDHVLPCYRVGSKILVRRSEFDAWIAAFRCQGPPRVVEALRFLGLLGDSAQSRASREGWARKKAAMQKAGTWDAFREKRAQITRDVAARRRQGKR